ALPGDDQLDSCSACGLDRQRQALALNQPAKEQAVWIVSAIPCRHTCWYSNKWEVVYVEIVGYHRVERPAVDRRAVPPLAVDLVHVGVALVDAVRRQRAVVADAELHRRGQLGTVVPALPEVVGYRLLRAGDQAQEVPLLKLALHHLDRPPLLHLPVLGFGVPVDGVDVLGLVDVPEPSSLLLGGDHVEVLVGYYLAALDAVVQHLMPALGHHLAELEHLLLVRAGTVLLGGRYVRQCHDVQPVLHATSPIDMLPWIR